MYNTSSWTWYIKHELSLGLTPCRLEEKAKPENLPGKMKNNIARGLTQIGTSNG